MTQNKDRLEKRVKELFGPHIRVGIEYRVGLPLSQESFEKEFNLLEEFPEILMDFYYLPDEELL